METVLDLGLSVRSLSSSLLLSLKHGERGGGEGEKGAVGGGGGGGRQTDRQAGRQTDRQTHRQADTQTGRHTDRQIEMMRELDSEGKGKR